tara:strand:+ start:1863 stop:2384 length:522 start_codon:yes stop_codon:yes gene_type:complete
MEVYKRLPLDLQYKIYIKMQNNYKKEILFPDIINRRSKFIENCLYERTYYIFSTIILWFSECNEYCWNYGALDIRPEWLLEKINYRIYKFFKNFVPDIHILSPEKQVHKYYDSLETEREKRKFISNILEYISIEDIEDIYNYAVYIYYKKNLNYAPLTKSSMYNLPKLIDLTH